MGRGEEEGVDGVSAGHTFLGVDSDEVGPADGYQVGELPQRGAVRRKASCTAGG